jgi:hypothetical protein
MAQYFLLLDGTELHADFRPALAASWHSRSFEPCRVLSKSLLVRMRDFAARYHLGSDEPLLAQVATGLPFDRTLWHHVVGEVLWYGAVEIPELPTAEQALMYLLAPEGAQPRVGRDNLPPILQAHRGGRDLVFGGSFYRPDHAGWNDQDDVERLAAYLGAVDVGRWQPQQLASWTELTEEERTEELADAQAWLPALAALYRQAADGRCVIVCEML